MEIRSASETVMRNRGGPPQFMVVDRYHVPTDVDWHPEMDATAPFVVTDCDVLEVIEWIRGRQVPGDFDSPYVFRAADLYLLSSTQGLSKRAFDEDAMYTFLWSYQPAS